MLLLLCAAATSCDSLPDYGIEYRIDDAYQDGNLVLVTYSVTNSGDEAVEDVTVEISVYSDTGQLFVGVSEPFSLGTSNTKTLTMIIGITGTFTSVPIAGTSTPQNVSITGVWFND